MPVAAGSRARRVLVRAGLRCFRWSGGGVGHGDDGGGDAGGGVLRARVREGRGDLDLRARCRPRSTTFRYRPISLVTAWQQAFPRRIADRTARTARAWDRSRGRTASPARRPFPAGAAASAASRTTPRVSPVETAQAASSCRIRSGSRSGASARCPGGAAQRRLGLPQRGLRPVPPPPVEGGELGRGVFLPVHQVGDQAEHLRDLLALDIGVVLDHPDRDRDAVAGQLRPVGGRRAGSPRSCAAGCRFSAGSARACARSSGRSGALRGSCGPSARSIPGRTVRGTGPWPRRAGPAPQRPCPSRRARAVSRTAPGTSSRSAAAPAGTGTGRCRRWCPRCRRTPCSRACPAPAAASRPATPPSAAVFSRWSPRRGSPVPGAPARTSPGPGPAVPPGGPGRARSASPRRPAPTPAATAAPTAPAPGPRPARAITSWTRESGISVIKTITRIMKALASSLSRRPFTNRASSGARPAIPPAAPGPACDSSRSSSGPSVAWCTGLPFART